MSIEYIKVTLEEYQPITVKVVGASFIGGFIDADALQKWIIHEVPTKVTATRFTTSETYVSGLLQVFLNGQKLLESDITEVDDTNFDLPIASLVTDVIEVIYYKKP